MLLPNLSTRNRQPELMDQPGLDPAAHHDALAGLERVNRLSFAARTLVRPIIARMQSEPSRRWRLLDVACGAGDVPIALAEASVRAGLFLEVAGCDVSETAVQLARSGAERSGGAATFFRRDALVEGLPEGYDFVTCSLFLHHLETEDAVTLLRAIGAAAGTLGLVSDLRRGRLGYAMAFFGTRLLSRSRIVHIDGPLSVRAAFTIEEALTLANEAGLTGRVHVTPNWPQRFLMTIEPTTDQL